MVAVNGVIQRYWNDTSQWFNGTDPQRSSDTDQLPGNEGSPWPSMGNALVAHNGIPVGMIDVAKGGAGITFFTPSTDAPLGWEKIKAAVRSLPVNGFKAFLWHQGEADAVLGTSQADYEMYFAQIFDQARIEAGWDFPIGIAQATWVGSFPAGAAAVQAAQNHLASTYLKSFIGANTDTITSATYRYDGTHFNMTGLAAHGALWEAALVSYFGF